MRLARLLIGFVYISAALVPVAVLTAPWWARRDGDLGFAFLAAGFFAVWLRLALATAALGFLLAMWALATARVPRNVLNLTVTAAGGFAVVALGGFAFYFLTS